MGRRVKFIFGRVVVNKHQPTRPDRTTYPHQAASAPSALPKAAAPDARSPRSTRDVGRFNLHIQ